MSLNNINTLALLTTHNYLMIIIYVLSSVALFGVSWGLKINSLFCLNVSLSKHTPIYIFLTLFFLNLAGVPPLPGFFIKLNFLVSVIEYINVYSVVFLVILNFTIFYIYIQFFKYIGGFSKQRSVVLCSGRSEILLFFTGLIFIVSLYSYLTII